MALLRRYLIRKLNLHYLFQNELSVLEFIHNIVETFDRYFESVVSLNTLICYDTMIPDYFPLFTVWAGCILTMYACLL